MKKTLPAWLSLMALSLVGTSYVVASSGYTLLSDSRFSDCSGSSCSLKPPVPSCSAGSCKPGDTGSEIPAMPT